jgi:hypothetical protein
MGELGQVRLVEHRHLGAAQGFGAADRRVAGQFCKGPRRQLDRCLRLDRPVRDQQRAGASIEECLGEPS